MLMIIEPSAGLHGNQFIATHGFGERMFHEYRLRNSAEPIHAS